MGDEANDLESVLNGTGGELPETPPEVPPEVPELGKGEEEPPAPPAEQPKEDPIKGLEKALAAERHKRQEEQRARQELEAQLAKQKEDDDPYAESIKNELRAEMQRAVINERLNISESFARDKYQDFDAKLETFAEMIKENPALYDAMVQQANPAEFAYKQAANQLKLKEMQDPEAYEKGLRERIKAELEAEMKTKFDETMKKLNVPGTLADARGAARTTEPAFSGPPPLSELFKEY